MTDVTIQRVEEIAPVTGDFTIPGIAFRPAAMALGVTAWGMNVLELDPGCDRYPEHNHEEDGQEEVYVVLRGTVTLHADQEQWALGVGAMVRVGPTQSRKFIPGDEGATLLAIGATPGQAYDPDPQLD